MSDVIDAWLDLYDARTDFLGLAEVATVGAVTGKKCISTEGLFDGILVAGGTAENGHFTLQMLMSDFTQEPEKNVDAVSCTNPALAGLTGLVVGSVTPRDGIYYITAADPSANP